MSNDLNQCNFIGRLGKDPEAKHLPNGELVTNFSLAIGSSFTNKISGDKRESVMWLNIVCFRAVADIANKYLIKGDQVYVSGKLSIRKWQDKTGADKWTTEIVANNIQMLNTKKKESNEPQKTLSQRMEENKPEELNDKIPF